MRRLTREEFLEMRRKVHEDWLRARGFPFREASIVIEDGDAVVRTWGGALEVRFPARALAYPDALSRRGF